MKKKITVSTLAFVSSANLGAVAEKCRQYRSLTMLVLLGCFLMLSACAPAKLTPVKKQKLDQAIQQDPSALNYWIRATAYRDVGQYWRAIEDYTRSIELDSSNPKVFNGRGVCYVKLGLHDQSIEDYSHAIELDPNYATPYYNLANAWGRFRRDRLGNLYQACKNMRKACDLWTEQGDDRAGMACDSLKKNCSNTIFKKEE